MADILSSVKTAKHITGEFHDQALQLYIDEVRQYMRDAGVDEAVINSEASVGVITRGVTDLWESGGTLSPYFYQRVSQLCYREETEPPVIVEDKLTKVGTITDKVENYDSDGRNGIYKKGDDYYLDFLATFSVARDSKAGWNINLAQIDDSELYPPIDLFYSCLFNSSQQATLKVWTTGLITVLPATDVSAGDFVTVQYTGEYGGGE